MNDARTQLDRLFAVDAAASVVFGVLSLLSPHGVLTSVSGGMYSHGVHETLRYVWKTWYECGFLHHKQRLTWWWFFFQFVWVSKTGVRMDRVACPISRWWSLSSIRLRSAVFLLHGASLGRRASTIYRSTHVVELGGHSTVTTIIHGLWILSISKRRKFNKNLWTAHFCEFAVKE